MTKHKVLPTEEICPYHTWGDSWPYWDELYAAEQYLSDYVYKYSRCRLICKEKYGTIRYEYIFAPGGSFRVGFRIKLPFIERKTPYGNLSIFIFEWQYSWIYKLWVKLGKIALRKAIRSACIKFPNVTKEILDDYNEEYI